MGGKVCVSRIRYGVGGKVCVSGVRFVLVG